MASFSVDKLVECFAFIGLNPGDNIVAKCLELCISYKITEEELVDCWAAFTISHLKNAPPTLEGLGLLERKELVKNKGNMNVASANIVQTPERKKPVPKTNNSTPKSTPKPSYQTPASQLSQSQQQNQSFTQDVSSADVSLSQVVEYSQRDSAGKVVYTHGDKPKYSPCIMPINVKLFGIESQWLQPNATHMHCYLNKQRDCQVGITECIANLIAVKHNITLDEHFDKKAFEGTCYGVIVTDGAGKLNAKSAMIELPSGDYSNGERIPLNLSQLSSYSLFPGQVCIAQGKLIKGVLQVEKLFTDGFITPIRKLEAEQIQIISASGPFTLQNNLLYEPLQDLLQTVLETKPHVLLLSGPFLDSEHSNVHSMTEAFDSFFYSIIESIMAPLENTNIQVVIVSSLRDVHHFPVYPTPPYELLTKFPNLLCVSDPCILNIEGVQIAVTTSDILFNLGKEEVSWPAGGLDRMSRLSQHLLHQRSFYPLQSIDNKLPIDYSLMEQYGLMETSPHILIVPSNFHHFVKNISGCTVINPERLVKGYSGGKYVRIQISKEESMKVSCEIVNI